MAKIIDIIHHKNKYYTQQQAVVDANPVFKYERQGIFLIAEDSGFFSFYSYRKSSEAFAGREFEIPLIDGEVIKATGQWWDYVPEDYNELIIRIGANTSDRLGECNVFMSMYVDPVIIEDWLKENEPSNNYQKYNKSHQDFGKHTIVSVWD